MKNGKIHLKKAWIIVTINKLTIHRDKRDLKVCNVFKEEHITRL